MLNSYIHTDIHIIVLHGDEHHDVKLLISVGLLLLICVINCTFYKLKINV